jgi:hypothetical protein
LKDTENKGNSDKQMNYQDSNDFYFQRVPTDLSNNPDIDYYPVMPKGKQMPLQPDGCYRVPGHGGC